MLNRHFLYFCLCSYVHKLIAHIILDSAHIRPKIQFKRAETEIVNVEITSILAQSETTYQIEWNEHIRTRTGALKETAHWKALISIYVVDSRDFTEQMISSNPAGIYVQNFSWTKI